jgi:transcriptional regulator with XRE-family HTH domain
MASSVAPDFAALSTHEPAGNSGARTWRKIKLRNGALLRAHRTASGLTQEQLAELAHVSVRAISDLERGVNASLRLYTLRQLADALELSPDDRATFEQTAQEAADAARGGNGVGEFGFQAPPPPGSLIAREKEMGRLRAALDAPTDGAVQLLLLEGETGACKTRLIQQVAVEAQARGFVVISGSCHASDSSRPY